MDRRTFLKCVGGLAVFATVPSVVALSSKFSSSQKIDDSSLGPIMRADLELRSVGSRYVGYLDESECFEVDKTGAQLVLRSDGTRSIQQLAGQVGLGDQCGEVAQFFVTLGQAGYLANRVEVELVQYKSKS